MWLEAETQVAINQAYTIGGKSFTRANLGEIRKQVEYWSNKVAELQNIAKKKGRNNLLHETKIVRFNNGSDRNNYTYSIRW